jgi:hypothetical protein
MNNNFDCVALKNKIQDEIYNEAEGDWKKADQIIHQLAAQSEWLKSLAKKTLNL